MELTFSRAQGLEEAKSFLTQALGSGKFPHALLVHGPEGVGQNPLILDLVDVLLCESPAMRPCGQCPGCLGRKRNNLDSLIFLMPIEKKDKAASSGSGDGEMEDGQVDELAEKAGDFHADPYGFTRSEKGNLNVGQIRSLQSRLSFAEASQRPRIVVILWAETMAASAANTLLKTLEEPPPNTYFLLSSDDRSVLLPTILSRCTQLSLFPMTPEALRASIAAKAGDWGMAEVPERLIPFAEGSPGALLALHRTGGEALIEETGRFLAASLRRDWMGFSAYLEESDAFADLQAASRQLHFLLRALRLFHRLSALEGPVPSASSTSAASTAGTGASGATGHSANAFAWTRDALKRQGLDPDLAAAIGPLETVGDPRALRDYSEWIEELLRAVQAYAKPKVAALGLYLEFSSKPIRNETRKEPQAC